MIQEDMACPPTPLRRDGSEDPDQEPLFAALELAAAAEVDVLEPQPESVAASRLSRSSSRPRAPGPDHGMPGADRRAVQHDGALARVAPEPGFGLRERKR